MAKKDAKSNAVKGVGPTAAGAGKVAEVPKDKLPETAGAAAGEATEKKEKKLIPGITRGRMPIAVVALVRYGENRNMETKDLAPLFGTTAGKIADIKRGSTFGYLSADFLPTKEQKAEGINWLKRHIAFKEGKVDRLIDELDSMDEATPEMAAKFETARIAARGQKATTKTGEVADAGGGNRRPTPKKAGKEKGAAPSAEELMK